MPDNVIQVGAVIDLSQIVPGFEQMSNSAKVATSSMNASFTSVSSGASVLEAAVDRTEKLNYSTTEARHALHGMGEEIGLKIPRFVQSFISQLGGIGPVLAEAFSAVALIGFAEVLVQATEKLSNWIGETFIYTAADKAMFNQLVVTNNAINERNKEIDKLKEAYKSIGLSSLGKEQVETNELLKQRSDITQKIMDTETDIWYMEHENKGGTAREIAETDAKILTLKNNIGDLNSQLGETNQKLMNVGATYDAEWSQGGRAAMSAHAELVKKTAEDEIATRQKQFEAEAQAGLINGEQEKILLMALSEEKLNVDKDYIAARRAILNAEQKATLKDTRADQEKLNADLETAEKDHQARMAGLDAIALKTYAQQLESRKAMTAAMYEPGGAAPELVSPDTSQQVKQTEIIADEQLAITERMDQDKLATHRITTGAWLSSEQNALDQWYQAQLSVISEALSEWAAFSGKDTTQYKELLDKKLELDRRYAEQKQTVEDKADKSEYTKMQQVLHEETDEVNRALVQWIGGHERWKQASYQIWDGILDKATGALLKEGEKFAATEMRKVAVKIASMALQNTAEQEGETVKQLIDSEGRLSAAKTAAANTWASVSGIPIVGPILAPIAAGAAFAAVLAFQQGGIVPQDTGAFLHAQEMVLPASIAQPLAAAAESGSIGGGHTFNLGHTINTVDSRGFDRLLESNTQAVRRSVTKIVRNYGAINRGGVRR